MGDNKLQLNYVKMEWLWTRSSSASGDLPYLVLEGVVHNLGVLPDSQLLLEEQVADVARRAFAQLWVVCQLSPFLN